MRHHQGRVTDGNAPTAVSSNTRGGTMMSGAENTEAQVRHLYSRSLKVAPGSADASW